ncbi:MAG: cell envelope integrity protein TolA [Xanthomonadales bacterium]|nr:cell envelope integrity protein TolA [Xanthomonadales bacterium]
MIYSRTEILERLRAFGGAIGVHVLMAALVVLGTMNWQPFRERQPVGLTIEAVIVDTAEIAKQRDEARRAQEMEERRERREAQLEQQRQREAEQRAEEQRRQQQLEEQRQREAQDRLNELRIQRERQQQEERERQQRQLEEVRRQREEAERKRQLEEERLKQLEAQRQREIQAEEQRQQQAEAQRRAEAEAQAFKAGQMATLSDNYISAIATAVTNNWLRPPTAQAGLECRVRVVQIPGGEIISSSLVGRCNGDEATRRSILAAVDRTGVLPYRGFEDVFQREIEFIFLYNGD